MIDIDNAVKIYVEGILELLEKDNNWKKTIAIWQLLYNNSSLRFFDNKNEFYSPITKESNPNNIVIGDKIITEYFHYCQNDPVLRWNKGTLAIYPNGEYESAFIWDNEAHLDYLETMSKTWFSSFYEEAVYRVEDRVKKANIPWDFETEVVISFTDNLPNPVAFTTSERLKMTFKLYLNQVWEYTKKTYASIFKSYDVANLERDNAYNIEQYKMMQSEELRVRFPRWNRATLWIDNTRPFPNSSRFDPKSIKLEWIDENGVIVESATSTEWLKPDNFDHSKGF